MSNSEIADIFERIALILELKGGENPFKIRAYVRAAEMIGNLSKDLRKVYEEGGVKALQEFPGIGFDLSLKIEEMVKTGKLKYLSEVESKVPKGLIQIMEIEGMGPKKTKFIWEKFKVKSIDDLVKLALSGKLEKLKGWGEKSVQNIIRGIEMRKKFSGRLSLPVATAIIEEIVAALRSTKLCEKIEVAGSFRRKRETVGDIDILATSKKPDEVIDFFCNLPLVDTITARGPSKATGFLRAGLDCDLRVVDPKSFGAALLYFTGSKDHNVHVRRLGNKKNLTLSEYGLYKGSAENKGKLVAAETEEEVYKAIGLTYVPPELREDRGEVEAALNSALPKLIEAKDLKADLHMHTNFSDGTATVEQMAKAAKDAGLSYIAITDHASSIGIVNGLKKDGKNMQEYLERIREARKKVKGIHILAGAEVDIERDGSLYLPDKLLKELDWVIASVHNHFHDTPEFTTERMLAAVRNPYVSVLGHPTARLIGKRVGIDYDIDTVLKEAKKRRVAVELNTSLERLDLSDVHLKRAKDLGVMVTFGSDAHTPQGIDFSYGISQARRGWLEKKDVLNTLSFEKFEVWRKKKK